MASRPELKVEDEQGFISFFHKLPPTESIRLFERGDFYTVHGNDAVFVAKTVYKTTSVIRVLGSSRNSLESCTLSITAFRNFLRQVLFEQGRRVEIWATQSGRRNSWELVKEASPGNLQDVEDDFAGAIEANPVIVTVKVAVKGDERTVGVCFADANVKELGVSEFVDNDLYSNLESLLISLGAREVVIQENAMNKDIELRKISQLIDRIGAAMSTVKGNTFSSTDIEQDLTRLLSGESKAGLLPFAEHKVAMSAAAALIKYLKLMHDEMNFGHYKLYQHDLDQYMKLDASAVRALNLIPGPRDGANKNMSLYGLLNKCKTPLGTRLLGQWLKQPLMNIEEIQKRQILVEAFVEDTELRQNMQEEHLKKISDIHRLTKRFLRKKANLEHVVKAYQMSIELPAFIGTFEQVMDEKYTEPLNEQYTKHLRKISGDLEKFQELVETTVDLDAIDSHEYMIKPEYNEDLGNIRERITQLEKDMRTEHHSVSRALGMEIDKKLFLEHHKVYHWCFRLTRTEAGAIRNKKEYKEMTTQKNGVYFSTTTLANLSREMDQSTQNYERTQRGLVDEVVGVAESYVPVFEELANVLAHLDVIVSFAHVSVHAPTAYVRPTVHPRGTGNTILTASRHPCMEQQDSISFIPNDVSLVRGESEFLIITGPNMGGKSTYIRQIAVIALMAQIGCFVPADEAEVCIFDCILARVGASDSQLKGVSTFMAEMLETATILKSATRESLIVIDELGRGTSTYDGFGLAWAIAEFIVREIGCFAMFATHFHELTALAAPDDVTAAETEDGSKGFKNVKNLHVVAHIGDNKDDVTLLYKVEPGVCDQSFGIHVAELVRFPQKVVKMARRKAAELEDFTSVGGHGPNQQESGEPQLSKEEIAKGSKALKQVLKEWRDEVEKVGGVEKVGAVEAKKMLQKLVDEKYQGGDAFLRSVKALG